MSEKLTDIFGIDTFDDATMRERLPESIYKALKKTIENGKSWMRRWLKWLPMQ